MEKVLVRGIALDENIAKISIFEVPDQPGIAFKLFSALAKSNIHVDMIVQNVNRTAVNDISFTIDVDELQEAGRLLDFVKQGLRHRRLDGEFFVEVADLDAVQFSDRAFQDHRELPAQDLGIRRSQVLHRGNTAFAELCR